MGIKERPWVPELLPDILVVDTIMVKYLEKHNFLHILIITPKGLQHAISFQAQYIPLYNISNFALFVCWSSTPLPNILFLLFHVQRMI